jgi:serine/threonine protein kinase
MQFIRQARGRLARLKPTRRVGLPNFLGRKVFSSAIQGLRMNPGRLPSRVVKTIGAGFITSHMPFGYGSSEDFPVDIIPGKALTAFKIVKQLGAGGCATVWTVTDVYGKSYALKAIPMDAEEVELRMREVNAMKAANAEHVVECYDAWIEPMTPQLEDAFVPKDAPVYQYAATEYMFFMKTELCDTNLTEWITRKERRPSQLWRVFRQVTQGLSDLHTKGFMHRDIKPDNIFVNVDESTQKVHVKVGDLGLAKFQRKSGLRRSLSQAMAFGGLSSGRVTSEIGTFAYMAPEQRDSHYNNKVDIYALGMLLWEMNELNYDRDERHMTLMRVRKTGRCGHWCTLKTPQSCSFIEQMIRPNPADRPTADEILSNLDKAEL